MFDHWLQPVKKLYRKHRAVFDAIPDEGARIDRMSEINIEMQVRRVAATPLVENAWARGQTLHLHGWIYGIHDGILRDLGPHLSSIDERDGLPSIDHRVLNPAKPVSAIHRQALAAFARLEDVEQLVGGGCCHVEGIEAHAPEPDAR
jgi:carbonic anhydrase